MSEEVIVSSWSEEAMKVIDGLCKKFGVAIDWTKENVWPTVYNFLQKYKTYEIVSNIVVILFWCACALVCFLCVKKVIKAVNDEKEPWYGDEYTPWSVGSVLLTGVLCSLILTALIVVPINITNIVKWIVLPELKWLSLLKGLV